MTKRIAVIKRVWAYLQRNITEAFENKNEADFDWYGEGQQAFWCALSNKPIKITPRVKSLFPKAAQPDDTEV
jgi:hypothetical protein